MKYLLPIALLLMTSACTAQNPDEWWCNYYGNCGDKNKSAECAIWGRCGQTVTQTEGCGIWGCTNTPKKGDCGIWGCGGHSTPADQRGSIYGTSKPSDSGATGGLGW